MEFFNFVPNVNGDIILKIKDNYTLEILENNTIKIKNKVIAINDKEKLKNYDYSFSEIKKFKVDNKLIRIDNYRRGIDFIHNIIDDGVKIISNTKLNIKTIPYNQKGFSYNEKVGLSIQNVDAAKSLDEICSQAVINKIKLDLEIKLNNGIELNIVL